VVADSSGMGAVGACTCTCACDSGGGGTWACIGAGGVEAVTERLPNGPASASTKCWRCAFRAVMMDADCEGADEGVRGNCRVAGVGAIAAGTVVGVVGTPATSAESTFVFVSKASVSGAHSPN